MTNLYVNVARFKEDIGKRADRSVDDASVERTLERVSRAVEKITGRRFYPRILTRTFDGRGEAVLYLHRDLVSVTTLKIDTTGDGTYDTALTETTDFWLWPFDEPPFRRIDLNPNSSVMTSFPTGTRRVEVVGVFGFSDATEVTGTTLAAAIADTTVTAVTVKDATKIAVGDTIRVESEDMYVSLILDAVLTVVRGMNGTTAATHAIDLTIRRVVYEPPVVEAVIMEAARTRMAVQTGQAGPPEFGGGVAATFPIIRDRLGHYAVTEVG